MALELVGGAVLGTAVAQLLKTVLDAKDKAAIFEPALTRLESTLGSVIPRVNEIRQLNHELKLPEEEMKELIPILRNGQALVSRCSDVSSINVLKRVKLSKKLLELDYSLLRYFQTILPLNHFRDTKIMLLMISEMYRKLITDKHIEGKSSKPMFDEYYSEIKSSEEPDEERKSSNPKFDEYYSEIKSSEEPDEGESINPKEDEYFEIQSCQDPKKKEMPGTKSLRRTLAFRAGAKDEEESSKSKEDESSQEPDEEESSKPEGEQNSDKKIILEGLIKIEDPITPSQDSHCFFACLDGMNRPNHGWSVVEPLTFGLKGCTYIFGPEEYSVNYDEKILYQEMGTSYVANCQCKKRHGYVMVSRVDKVGIGKSEFEQQMKTFGKIENHPNIVSLFGFCFHQSELFLFYDTFPKGAAKGASLYTRLHDSLTGDSWRVADSDSAPIRSAPGEFSWESKLKIIHGVARGISHLHSVECIHGNLHSYNVIINSDFDGCISDYGLLNFSRAAKQSDVNSFGVIPLEMLSGTVPPDFEDHHRWVEKVVSVQEEKYPKIETLFGIKRQKRKMLKIAKLCVERDMDKRPEMDYVVKEIQKIRKSLKKIA